MEIKAKEIGFLLIFLACGIADAKQPRSQAVKAAFQRSNPCPATNKHRGACPGYVKDHIIPLCAGGADTPENMQWQTVAESKVKDRDEWRMCRKLKGKYASRS